MREYKMRRGEHLEDRVPDMEAFIEEYFGEVTDTEEYKGNDLLVVDDPDNPVFDRVVAGTLHHSGKKDKLALHIDERDAEDVIAEGHVDAAVWNLDDMSMHLGDRIAHRPLSEKVRDAVGERTTAAAIVTRPDGDTTRPVFDGILDVQRIGEIQEKVMSGEIVPEY
jgi:hypothetical protein